MKSIGWFKSVIVAVLLVVLVLAVVRPDHMVSPGPLSAGHTALNNDCFACHVPLLGATPERCISCHAIADIGIRDSLGKPLEASKKSVRFHQGLADKNCLACHSDHPPPRLSHVRRMHFTHESLEPGMARQCNTCHEAPATELHQKLADKDCSECHAVAGWSPSSYDHDRYFVLAGPHQVECTTCHAAANFKTYSCFGCHEHQPDAIREEHLEEGIRNIDDCVRCHRNPEEEPAEPHEAGEAAGASEGEGHHESPDE
jgi:hypothetical protein